MNQFRNILLISHAEPREWQALHHSLELAARNDAALTILVLYPALPAELSAYRDSLEQGLFSQIREEIDRFGGADKLTIRMNAAGTALPSVEVIRRVLEEGHDLVVKEADRDNVPEKGFHAFDMDLLRKCPCPVWLCRPFHHPAAQLKIAVAVDTENEDAGARKLSLRLLRLGAVLASVYRVPLHVASCWDFPMENYLRHSTWVSLPDQELTDMIVQTRTRHERALLNLIREAEITVPVEPHRIRGPAAQGIPLLMEDGLFDILIMGTVARTGIPGFIIGNTAEDILHKIDCSLLALKPAGFISPVRI